MEELRADDEEVEEGRESKKCSNHPADVEIEKVDWIGKRIKGWGVCEVGRTHRHGRIVGKQNDSYE